VSDVAEELPDLTRLSALMPPEIDVVKNY